MASPSYMDRRWGVLAVLVSVASAALLVAVVWLNFAIDWHPLLSFYPPDPVPGRITTSYGPEGLAFRPPLQVAVALALAAVLRSMDAGDRRRAVGWTVVLSGFVVLLVALGPVRCGFDITAPIDGRGATYDPRSGVLRFGIDYICRTYPSEPGLLVAYGLVTVGATVGVGPSGLDRVARRWRSNP